MDPIAHADFYRERDSVPRSKIVAFLKNLTAPCFESELLKLAFNHTSITGLDALTLYQNHFILFNLLYTLQDELSRDNQYLHVHFMRTFLTAYPAGGQCRFYDEYTGLFCNAPTNSSTLYYCPFHQQKVGDSEIELLSSKYFYFDIDNYYKLDHKSVDDFMNGSWEVLAHFDDIRNSFKILDLPETAGLPMIKQRFKTLAKVYHPDLQGGNSGDFNRINNAYRLLLKTISLHNPFK